MIHALAIEVSILHHFTIMYLGSFLLDNLVSENKKKSYFV